MNSSRSAPTAQWAFDFATGGVVVSNPLPTYPSPLRYPGAKRRLLPAINELLDSTGLRPKVLVEPFAGGASVSLGLLGSGRVESVVLADKDPLLWAFWDQAAFNADQLISAMWDEPVTVDRWRYWKTAKPDTKLGMAVRCLFLNRTSFSGILHGSAGPIGGMKQLSESKIGCRFNKDRLADVIAQIGVWGSERRIREVRLCSWQDAASGLGENSADVLLYLDPPYVEKADRLYTLSFTDLDHRELADYLHSVGSPWILSYDDVPTVAELYTGWAVTRPAYPYTSAGARCAQTPGREVLISTLAG